MTMKKQSRVEFDPTLFITIEAEGQEEQWYQANTSLQACDIERGHVTRVAVYKLSHVMECTSQVQIVAK